MRPRSGMDGVGPHFATSDEVHLVHAVFERPSAPGIEFAVFAYEPRAHRAVGVDAALLQSFGGHSTPLNSGGNWVGSTG